jgi:hypothetical protein
MPEKLDLKDGGTLFLHPDGTSRMVDAHGKKMEMADGKEMELKDCQMVLIQKKEDMGAIRTAEQAARTPHKRTSFALRTRACVQHLKYRLSKPWSLFLYVLTFLWSVHLLDNAVQRTYSGIHAMTHDNDIHASHPAFWRSRYASGLIVMGGIAGFFLLTQHWAHFLGALPYLLLLACPLMHLFMHHGHGHGKHKHQHAAGGSDQDETQRSQDRQP